MSDFKEASRDVQRLKRRLDSAADRSLKLSMETVKEELQRYLHINRSVATGMLHDGLERVPQPTTGVASYGIIGPEYWKYLEFGTGVYSSRGYKGPSPGAPYEDILVWLRAKGEIPDPSQQADTQEELAHLIADSVSKGTEQHQFVRPAWRGPLGRQYVIKLVKDSMERQISRTF